MPNIILFGQMGAGKTTIADILVRKYGYRKFSLGEKIHSECAIHGTHSRPEMQKYGQMMREIFGEHVWNQYLFNKIHNFPTNANLIELERVVIDDGRQLNEFEFWSNKKFKCVGVYAPEVDRINRLIARTGKFPTDEQLKHETETQAEECAYKASHLISNAGTLEDLEVTVETFMRNLYESLIRGEGD